MNCDLKISQNQKMVYCGRTKKAYDGFTYFACRDISPGEIVVRTCPVSISDHQTKHISIQFGANKHLIPSKWTGRYLNHSCEPNCHVETGADGYPNITASRLIKKDEEISYSYFMTEENWSSQSHESYISCLCGAKNCKKKIISFSQLSNSEKIKFKQRVSRYLQNSI